jgi:hypothetical protein
MEEESIEARMGRLRGDRLPMGGIGAREIEQATRNVGCDRVHALLLAGVAPTVAEMAVYGGTAPAQSTFALQKGSRFERTLCTNGGDRLLALYRANGRLMREEVSVVDIAQLTSHTLTPRPVLPPAGATTAQRRAMRERRATALLRQRADLTLLYLRHRLSGDPDAPTIILQACLPLTILGRTYHVVPDLLIAGSGDRCYRVGEIKLYPDRRGRTALEDVRGASRQAAVAVVALRRLLLQEGLDADAMAVLVPPTCDLILRAVDTMRATLRPRSIEAEVADIERLIDHASARAEAILGVIVAAGFGPSATIADAALLDAIPARYDVVRCGLCALRDRCLAAARAAGDPVTLGRPARDELAPIGPLPEILDLVDGVRAFRDDAQADRVRRLTEAEVAWRRAVAGRAAPTGGTAPDRQTGVSR